MKIMITTSLVAPLYMYNVMVKGHYYINETMARIHFSNSVNWDLRSGGHGL